MNYSTEFFVFHFLVSFCISFFKLFLPNPHVKPSNEWTISQYREFDKQTLYGNKMSSYWKFGEQLDHF